MISAVSVKMKEFCIQKVLSRVAEVVLLYIYCLAQCDTQYLLPTGGLWSLQLGEKKVDQLIEVIQLTRSKEL